jgi:hypothetical protein
MSFVTSQTLKVINDKMKLDLAPRGSVTEICLWRSILVVKRNFCFPQPKSARLIIALSKHILSYNFRPQHMVANQVLEIYLSYLLLRLSDMKEVNSENLGKFDAQSLSMIAIGKCPNSNGLLFYNPVNHTFVSSIHYQFQHHMTSGARFNL